MFVSTELYASLRIVHGTRPRLWIVRWSRLERALPRTDVEDSWRTRVRVLKFQVPCKQRYLAACDGRWLGSRVIYGYQHGDDGLLQRAFMACRSHVVGSFCRFWWRPWLQDSWWNRSCDESTKKMDLKLILYWKISNLLIFLTLFGHALLGSFPRLHGNPLKMYFPLGAMARIPCLTNHDNTAVYWTKDGQQLNQTHMKINHQGHLYIRSTQFSDQGLYICKPYSPTSFQAHLTVLHVVVKGSLFSSLTWLVGWWWTFQ